VRLYDVLLRRQPSALVALNRAIAVDHVHGPAAALAALDAIPLADDLTGDVDGYVYFHTARADVLAQLDRLDDATAALDAIPLADDLVGDVDGYVYFHTARADVLARLDRLDDASAALDRAIECSTNESERSFLRRRLQDLNETVDLPDHRN
jgi:RNA polymerase sigma-70 factor (ECF subfamily)